VKEATGRAPTVLRRVSRADIPDRSVAAAAFSLEKGAVSEPVKSALGWHVLHVTAIDPGKTARFEEHREKIRNELAREMAVDDIISLTGKLDDTLATGAPLEEAASAIGAQARKIEAISAEGLDPSGKPVSGIPKDPVFLERVFSAAAGEPSNVEEARGGGFFVLRVDKVIPPAVRPLSEVRARATDEWKQRKLNSTARAKAETLQKAAKSAGSLAQAAKTGEHKLVTSEPFSRFRRDPDSPISAELSAALFSAKSGEVVVAEVPGGYGVASVTKVLPAEPGNNREEMQNLRAELKSALANDTVSQYIAALRKQYPVTINRAALDAATGVDSGG
jgi:peptidyl-prolyl cis-trans isomerase D